MNVIFGSSMTVIRNLVISLTEVVTTLVYWYVAFHPVASMCSELALQTMNLEGQSPSF